MNTNTDHSDRTSSQPCENDDQDASSHSSLLSVLLQDIAHERERQTACVFVTEVEDVELVFTPRWPLIFQKAFLDTALKDSPDGPRDDLLFFVFKNPKSRPKFELKVFRHNSAKLPDFKDPSIDWEETVYLNLLMQYLVYTVTVAVCTRTGPQELQILNKFSETVYASPNRRRMDSKGKTDELVYPNLFFSVDNYDEVFSKCVIRDSECLCVELTAYDLSGKMRGVCFLGTIQYDALKKFYDSKPTTVQRSDGFGLLSRQFGSMSGRGNLCNLGTVSSQPTPAVKFMRMLGPQAQGLAEFAVCAVEHGPEDRFTFCRCGKRLSLLGPVCCACGATGSPVLRMFDDLSDQINPDKSSSSRADFLLGSPVTKQPTQVNPDFSVGTDYTDWLDFSDCGIPQFAPKNISGTAAVQHIDTLHSIPSSAKSAGASAETSPVRRWSYIRGPNRVRNNPTEPDQKGLMQNGPRLDYQPRRGSKVSEILDRFTRIGGTTDRTDSTQPVMRPNADSSTAVTDNDRIGNRRDEAKQSVERENIVVRSHSIGEENDDVNDGCLFGSREGHRRSFGQAWLWFKERRRLTSVGLNASLTFLSIPSAGILMDILESKREPILNIAD